MDRPVGYNLLKRNPSYHRLDRSAQFWQFDCLWLQWFLMLYSFVHIGCFLCMCAVILKYIEYFVFTDNLQKYSINETALHSPFKPVDKKMVVVVGEGGYLAHQMCKNHVGWNAAKLRILYTQKHHHYLPHQRLMTCDNLYSSQNGRKIIKAKWMEKNYITNFVIDIGLSASTHNDITKTTAAQHIYYIFMVITTQNGLI